MEEKLAQSSRDRDLVRVNWQMNGINERGQGGERDGPVNASSTRIDSSMIRSLWPLQLVDYGTQGSKQKQKKDLLPQMKISEFLFRVYGCFPQTIKFNTVKWMQR